ncbi:hypothetical protein KJY99_10355 [Cutibacterium avidum]|uniref:hypothetical protein n=1 Tax=Cutibacterium avidum TaxID=33010 RepID=UPI002093520C|nr:hypothetical protein [Cutibacterium avidum]MCO6678983.1 hypothetical protein [Cutibacterium avidum]
MSGVGHAYSDLDIYAVPRDPDDVAEPIFRVNDVVVQLNLIERETFLLLSREFCNFTYSSDDKSQLDLFAAHEKIVSRLAAAEVVVPQASELGGFSIDAECVRKLSLVVASIQMARSLEDAAGAELSGATEIAAQASLRAVDYAIRLCLLAVGILHRGDAVSWAQLRRSERIDEPLAAALIDAAVGMFPAPGLDARTLCRVASMVGNHVLLRAWDGPASFLGREILPSRPVPGHLEVNPYFTLSRFSDAMGIVGPDRGIRVNSQTAEHWVASDGLPEGEMDAAHGAFLRAGVCIVTSGAS